MTSTTPFPTRAKVWQDDPRCRQNTFDAQNRKLISPRCLTSPSAKFSEYRRPACAKSKRTHCAKLAKNGIAGFRPTRYRLREQLGPLPSQSMGPGPCVHARSGPILRNNNPPPSKESP
jgi:hypothetical protein